MALFVAFEGLPGCGKSTAIGALAKELRSRGLRVKVIDMETSRRAPALRAITRAYPFGHPVQIIIFWALRLQQSELIERLMDSNDIIIADRFWGSTLAIGLYGDGIPRDVLE